MTLTVTLVLVVASAVFVGSGQRLTVWAAAQTDLRCLPPHLRRRLGWWQHETRRVPASCLAVILGAGVVFLLDSL